MLQLGIQLCCSLLLHNVAWHPDPLLTRTRLINDETMLAKLFYNILLTAKTSRCILYELGLGSLRHHVHTHRHIYICTHIWQQQLALSPMRSSASLFVAHSASLSLPLSLLKEAGVRWHAVDRKTFSTSQATRTTTTTTWGQLKYGESSGWSP